MANYLGLDMGGTNVKAGVVDEGGKLIARVSVPTGGGGGRDALSAKKVLRQMVVAGEEAMKEAGIGKGEIAAVGVLSPGQASLEKGIIYRSANLPLWKNVKIRAVVSKGLGLPAVLENDANAAAYGEWWVGAGKGKVGSLFMFTLGTGVGGGYVYEGKVVRGHSDFAAEVGHMILYPGGEQCGCGQRGCLEAYTSASYTGKRASRELESKKVRKRSSLGKVFKDAGKVTSADVVQHAKAGDKFALGVWDEACRNLAVACVNVCHLLDPEMIVLGGGMSAAGGFLLECVRRHFAQSWWKMTPPGVKIVLAKLGNDAGVIGAAGVAREAERAGRLPGVGK